MGVRLSKQVTCRFVLRQQIFRRNKTLGAPRFLCVSRSDTVTAAVAFKPRKIWVKFFFTLAGHKIRLFSMKSLIPFTCCILSFGSFVFPAQAAFTSLYVFGDGVSTTTNNTEPYPSPTNYYGQRFSNGRVWVEVLAQRQGLAYNPSNNWSYFGDYSSDLVANVSNFPAPPDASTALFVIWVNDADVLFDEIQYLNDPSFSWTNAISESQSNHVAAIQTLYAKGVRTLIMPNTVDISEIPFFAYTSSDIKSFVRQRCIDYNVAFGATLNQARASLPGITIYEPDVFTLFDNILTNAAAYGLTNAGIDALEDPSLTDLSLNGPGANYIFWDALDPSARANEVMADVVQQLISPVQISKIKVFNGSNRLDVVNMPVGLDGFADGSTNLLPGSWTANASFSGTNTTQSIFVLTTSLSQNSLRFSPKDGPPPPRAVQNRNSQILHFSPNDGPPPPEDGGTTNAVVFNSTLQVYRLRFPFSWSWP